MFESQLIVEKDIKFMITTNLALFLDNNLSVKPAAMTWGFSKIRHWR